MFTFFRSRGPIGGIVSLSNPLLAAFEGYFVSIVHPDGTRMDRSARQRLVACVLDYPRLIGHRRWGMVHLYYRAGLSQREIADVFGIRRQMVTYELKQAFRLVAEHLRKRGRRKQPNHGE